MQVYSLEQIKTVLPQIDLLPAIEAGFVAYSAENATIPPVGELLLDKGEVHIKYGYIDQQDYYVIKIASGFYGNPALGLPSSNGVMLLFSQQSGELVSVLHDEGYLTDTRTAVAGAIAAKHLAPSKIERIGIVGTGIQARMQLDFLRQVSTCRKVLVWGRSAKKLCAYQERLEPLGFTIETTTDTADILQSCNLIVTTTPSTEPLLHSQNLQAGTHITAVGSDTPHKQELDAAILERADIVVADSIPQCLMRGEIYQAIAQGKLASSGLVELGAIIAGDADGRQNDEQITVADLTGVAVQDIQIASAVFDAF